MYSIFSAVSTVLSGRLSRRRAHNGGRCGHPSHRRICCGGRCGSHQRGRHEISRKACAGAVKLAAISVHRVKQRLSVLLYTVCADQLLGRIGDHEVHEVVGQLDLVRSELRVVYGDSAVHIQHGAVIRDPQRNECKVTLIGEVSPQISKGIRLFLIGNLQRRAHSLSSLAIPGPGSLDLCSVVISSRRPDTLLLYVGARLVTAGNKRHPRGVIRAELVDLLERRHRARPIDRGRIARRTDDNEVVVGKATAVHPRTVSNESLLCGRRMDGQNTAIAAACDL